MDGVRTGCGPTEVAVAVCLLAVWLTLAGGRSAAADEPAKEPYVLDAVPPGYSLQAYDDCGSPSRQPHVRALGAHQYSPATVNADAKARTVAWGWREVNAVYEGLRSDVDYLLAVTYANEPYNNRVQSLWTGDICLHGPHTLPKGTSERLLFKVPPAAIREGRLDLQFRLEAEVNVVVSAIELWAPLPAQTALRLDSVSALVSDLEGRVLDSAWDPVEGAEVALQYAGSQRALATARSDRDGRFTFERSTFAGAGPVRDVELVANHEGVAARRTVSAGDLVYAPIRYRPVPTRVGSLRTHRLSLDGSWRIDPRPREGVRSTPLDAPSWRDFRVPGQWRQQGFDIPQEQTVAVAREFVVPEEWSAHRVFLRFDAIHAGTHYWINGQLIGYSENLFTPVEWEITSQVRPGATNRLDLEMKVDTVSEGLSYSSGYAFHNLGGIDRSVSIFALPPVHVRALRADTRLDEAYRDADLELELALDNPQREAVSGLAISVKLTAPDGRPARHSAARLALDPLPPGTKTVKLATRVADPLRWSAEKPHLYRLTVDLTRDGKLVERLERSIGFRQIEVRGTELLVNGVPVKLAGACHHEVDPLTGRADTARHAETDVKLLKAANLNYLRTSHYPPTIELVDAADKYGMYLEVEAPFCWVGETDDLDHLREVLAPTSAMVDTYQSHPSVILWSLANESHFNRAFEISHQLVKQLDPTRATTFNNPDPKRICDLANLHYPGMPYDEQAQDDPRPLLLGEYFFPVCHEQTDVQINPGLREFFGFGHSDPDSPWGRECAESFTRPFMKPCTPPGAWSHIAHSQRVIGGAIWAALDDAFYFPDGTHAGYAWHHGFWGLIDAWRRPKPERWLAKLVFSPVWFPARRVEYTPGQRSIRLPVENRYSFTDLAELTFTWEVGRHKGNVRAAVAARSRGEIEVPIPLGTPEGETLVLRVTDAHGKLVTPAVIQLGRDRPVEVPRSGVGAPDLNDEGALVVIRGDGFSLVFDKTTGDFRADDPRHQAGILHFPVPHVTQYDFGDLAGAHGKPYAVYPDAKTRVVDEAAVHPRPEGVEVVVRDRYAMFAGSTTWLLDRHGLGTVTYDYTYSGPDMDTREAGVRFALKPTCDEITWRRWSEWGDVFPEDSISRTAGRAKALRTGKREADPGGVPPTWPWSLDQTELGTADFRAVKFNVYEAALLAPDGTGLRVHARADAHVRPCLADGEILLHVLSRCPLGQVVIRDGDRIAGQFTVEVVGRGANKG